MTTIAYRQGILATDKQGSEDGVIMKACIKAQHIGDKVYAIAGTLTCGLKFVAWLEGDRRDDAPKLKGTCVIEMCMKTGACQFWECEIPLPVEDRFYAWGSGAAVALGAMEWGANARNAIKCATKWDDGTGKGVQVFVSKRAQPC